MKTLLIHTPKFNNFYRPIGDFMWLNYMPAGLLAIADYLKRQQMEVEVVHLGVEWVENRDFCVNDLIDQASDVKAVGLSLHWHHQAFDVIEIARRIKKIRGDIFIFLGGDTASFFHDEILRDFSEIDAVIRGYGEKPLLEMLEALRKSVPLNGISNITWRKDGRIVQNSLDYTGDQGILNELCFTNFSLLRHSKTYIDNVGLPFFYAKGFSREWNSKHLTLKTPVYPIPIGRGCPFNCSWCGGSHVQQQKFVSGFGGFVYRSHENVIMSIKDAMAAGYGTMQSAMDPEPENQGYFTDLWREIRKEGIKTNWMFECNGLPTDTFLEEFQKTFPGKDSIIAISPECGNEALRLKHKGPAFSTKALLMKLDHMERLGISSEIFFTYGLPGENEKLLEETFELQRNIAKSYSHVRAIRTHSIEMEPGAPWFMKPEEFGVVTDRKSFKDFYEAHSNPNNSPFNTFGYYIPDYFPEPLDPEKPFDDFARRMQSIKCRKFCSIHPNPRKCGKKPWQGRLFCKLVSRLIKLKPRNLSRPY